MSTILLTAVCNYLYFNAEPAWLHLYGVKLLPYIDYFLYNTHFGHKTTNANRVIDIFMLHIDMNNVGYFCRSCTRPSWQGIKIKLSAYRSRSDSLLFVTKDLILMKIKDDYTGL